MVHNNNLWDLFFLTGELKYYLELINNKNITFDKQNNNEFCDTDNDSLR